MTAVIARFLEWADREDAALHSGLPPPKFEALDGTSIFPNDGEEWWLTDVQLRKEKAAEIVIEDGPPSDDEAQDEAPLVLSDDDCSDGLEDDDSDSSVGAPHDDDAMDWGTADGNVESARDSLAPAPRQLPLALWR